ncbi:MAG: TolC family protein [Gammaproteobacteria bacterium]
MWWFSSRPAWARIRLFAWVATGALATTAGAQTNDSRETAAPGGPKVPTESSAPREPRAPGVPAVRGGVAAAGGAADRNALTAIEPTGSLTLAAAIRAALRGNPDLAASAYDIKAADARIEQARLRLNPELAVELENFAGSGETRSAHSLETTLRLSQVIELGNKRALRESAATSSHDFVIVARQAQQLDVLATVTQRYIDLAAAQEHVNLAINTREIAQRTADAISARVQAARSPEAERSRANIALIRANIEERQAQSELRSARLALAAVWGGTEPSFDGVSADLFAIEPIEAFENLVARLERNPDFVRFASEGRLRDAELRLARAQARPNLTFAAGIRRLNVSNDTALVAGFSMPLQIFDRNQGNVREAEVRLAQNDVARRAAFLRARATLYGLYQELLTSRNRMQTLRTDALTQAQRALEQTQFGYDRGRFSYLELATTQQDVLDIRAAAIDAAADAHRALAEIERLTGEPLAASE